MKLDWRKVNTNQWPWNLAYVLHHRVYHNTEKAERFAQSLYFPGLVEIMESSLTIEEQEQLVLVYRSKNKISHSELDRLLDKLATPGNIKRMAGIHRFNLPEEVPEEVEEDTPLLETLLVDTDIVFATLLSTTSFEIEPDYTHSYRLIRTVGDLTQFSKHDLNMIHRIGPRSVEQIQKWLNAHGLSLNPCNQFYRCSCNRYRRHQVVLMNNHILRIPVTNRADPDGI